LLEASAWIDLGHEHAWLLEDSLPLP